MNPSAKRREKLAAALKRNVARRKEVAPEARDQSPHAAKHRRENTSETTRRADQGGA